MEGYYETSLLLYSFFLCTQHTFFFFKFMCVKKVMEPCAPDSFTPNRVGVGGWIPSSPLWPTKIEWYRLNLECPPQAYALVPNCGAVLKAVEPVGSRAWLRGTGVTLYTYSQFLSCYLLLEPLNVNSSIAFSCCRGLRAAFPSSIWRTVMLGNCEPM